MNLLTIHLHSLRFFSYHGLHEEEKIAGGTFEVNADIKMKTSDKIEEISQTLDYCKVYDVIKAFMNQPTPLLETLAQRIVDSIHELDDRIVDVSLTVTKCNPPIIGFSGNVGVSLQKTFDS
jgi:dihydroneopterin aldolase